MSKTKITYNGNFKAEAIRALLKGDKTLNEVARQYGISPATLSKWHQQFEENLPQVFGDQERSKDREIRDLKDQLEHSQRKIGQLTLERDWLEKKSDEIFGPNGPHRAYLDSRK